MCLGRGEGNEDTGNGKELPRSCGRLMAVLGLEPRIPYPMA